MRAIRRITAREILDSRGNPTVEADVELEGGAFGRGMAPSGASTGRHEAVELRDGDSDRYGGRGVLRAVANVRDVIAPALIDMPADQERVDERLVELDGTASKSHLGSNAILPVSLAVARAAAAAQGVPLYHYFAEICPDRPAPAMPVPMVNILSGGLHTGGTGAGLDVQDFLVVPVTASSYGEGLEWCVRVHRVMRELLADGAYTLTGVADEGGLAPALESNRRGLELMVEAFGRANIKAAIALDIASTHFYRDGRYHLNAERRALTAPEMIEMLVSWCDEFPIMSIEDGLAEDDWDGWNALTARVGARCQLVGDDLFTTNPARLARGIAEGAANAILVKMNQIGTITETLRVVAQAREAGYRVVISARSGETEDDSLADLAAGTGAGQIKIGSITRSERLAKYNRLLRIQEELS